MFRLIIEDDEGRTTVVPLVRKQISIGRDESNAIRLPERNVSRRHAKLIVQGDKVFIEDLGSYNGVWVEGRRIEERTEIRPGELLQIGDYHMEIRKEGEEEDRGEEGVEKSARRQLERAPELDRTLPDMLESTEQLPAVKLVLLNTERRGEEFYLRGEEIKIGRAEDCEIWLDHPSLSRHHAKIVVENSIYKLIDLNSSNGTFVNGEEFRECDLKLGDIIVFGEVKFKFSPAREAVSPEEAESVSADSGQARAPSGEKQALPSDSDERAERKNMVLLVGLGMLVAVLGLTALFLFRSKGKDTPKSKVAASTKRVKSDAKGADGVQVEKENFVRESLNRALELGESEEYDRAIALIDQVLESDPQNQKALELKERFEQEKRDNRLLNDALSLKAEGKVLEAVKTLQKIQPDSKFASSAKELLQEIKPEALKSLEKKITLSLKSKKYYEALQYTNELLDLEPESEVGKKFLAVIRGHLENPGKGGSTSPKKPRTVKEKIQYCLKLTGNSSISCLKQLERRRYPFKVKVEIYSQLIKKLYGEGQCGKKVVKNPLFCLEANTYKKKLERLKKSIKASQKKGQKQKKGQQQKKGQKQKKQKAEKK